MQGTQTMLVLARKEREKIRIGEQIVVSVERLSKSQVQIGVEAPRSLPILRAELSAAAAEAYVDPFTVRVTAEWLQTFFGVERKEVNAQHFTWHVPTVIKDGGGRPLVTFEWEWDECGRWLRLCNLSATSRMPHLVAYWDRASRGEVERVCRCLGMSVAKVAELQI